MKHFCTYFLLLGSQRNHFLCKTQPGGEFSQAGGVAHTWPPPSSGAFSSPLKEAPCLFLRMPIPALWPCAATVLRSGSVDWPVWDVFCACALWVSEGAASASWPLCGVQWPEDCLTAEPSGHPQVPACVIGRADPTPSRTSFSSFLPVRRAHSSSDPTQGERPESPSPWRRTLRPRFQGSARDSCAAGHCQPSLSPGNLQMAFRVHVKPGSCLLTRVHGSVSHGAWPGAGSSPLSVAGRA